MNRLSTLSLPTRLFTATVVALAMVSALSGLQQISEQRVQQSLARDAIAANHGHVA